MPFDSYELQDWQKTLLKAAEIVRERWMQGGFGHKGGPRCGIGAVMEVAGYQNRANGIYDNDVPQYVLDVQERLDKHVGSYFALWNDEPGRTAEEVAQAMEQCALTQTK